jgi:hypothetical protein
MTESWLTGILAKRPHDGICVLADLLEAGLRYGRVSANCIRDRHFAEVNIIGATMRTLKKFGFTHTDERVRTAAAKKHGRRVDVWRLDDPAKARAGLDAMRKIFLHAAAKNETPCLPGL